MHRHHAPAAERNKRPIAAELSRVLPKSGVVLEIASGTGQHAAHFAAALPHLDWHPSDTSEAALASIHAYVAHCGRSNLHRPIHLDVLVQPWPIERADAVVCINMMHIAPWEASVALFEGSARLLEAGNPLVTYGPYRRDDRHTAPSNAAFDASLRDRDPSWGIRDIDDLRAVAERVGFQLSEVVAMPANNMTLVWHRLRKPVAT